MKILEKQPDNELPTRTFNITTEKVEVTFGRMGRYATVSYVWNQYDDETLKRELRRCLESTGIHLVWVDRWCINQQDAADKTIEIPKMAQYYKQAALGLCLVPEVECLPGTWGFKGGKKNGTEKMIEIRTKVGNSQWMSRVWTFQEAELGPNPVLAKGGDFWPLPALLGMRWATTTEVGGDADPFGYTLTMAYRQSATRHRFGFQEAVQAIINMGGRGNETKQTLSSLLARTIIRECTVEVDRIYGVLALASDAAQVKIDYQRTHGEVVSELVGTGLLPIHFIEGDSPTPAAQGKSWHTTSSRNSFNVSTWQGVFSQVRQEGLPINGREVRCDKRRQLKWKVGRRRYMAMSDGPWEAGVTYLVANMCGRNQCEQTQQCKCLEQPTWLVLTGQRMGSNAWHKTKADLIETKDRKTLGWKTKDGLKKWVVK